MTDLREQLQRTLGDAYTIERELGGGGMSRVFVAHEQTLGRRVVVKTLSADVAGGVNVERFRREIRFAAALQQANIVPVLAAGETGGLPYFTMPFVEGESLRARLVRHGALPVRETVGILRDVARALAFAHEHGVVHRDIKPGNVLLSGSTAVVTDFGIAKALEASQTSPAAPTLTHLGTALGTPVYMAPEQAAGEEVDFRADIYALGVLAYELLAGAPPFTGKTAQALIAAHIRDTPPALAERCRDVPGGLAALVMRCLEKEPDRRPQSAQEVLELLESASTPAAAPARGGLDAKPSVAVLPLTNMIASADDEYFSDGVTEDIIAQLSRIASLKVISRTSVMRYKKTEKGAREIAGELGASHLVTGSVRRAGRRLRIIAQLVDARSDEQLWAQTFDREMTDVFAIQGEVAEATARALAARLTPAERQRIERKPTDNVEAYNWYLLGRYALNKRRSEDLEKAIECFEHAIAEDASYAAPHAGLADAYTLAAIGYGAAPRDALPRARAAALRAIALDDSLAEAHTSLGYVHLNFDWDFFAARREFERALELNPSSAQAHQWLAQAYAYVGQFREMIPIQQRALELDPLSVVLTGEAGWPYAYLREWERAATHFQRALAMDPDFALAHHNLAWALEGMGRSREALAEHQSAVRLSNSAPFMVAFLARMHAALGEMDQARRLLAQLTTRAEAGEAVNVWVALVLDALGQPADALAWLERAYDAREPTMTFLYTGLWTTFDNASRDPRFHTLLDRIGMAEQARRARAV